MRLADPDSTPKIRTLVFIDLETTGLLAPKITELSMVAVHVDCLKGNGSATIHHESVPRVLNRITLCFQPLAAVEPKAEEMTGLNNYNLEAQKDFDDYTRHLILGFLKRLYPPVCMVAHNGANFDFPILLSEWLSIEEPSRPLQEAFTHPADGSPIYCVDSLPLLRELDAQNQQTTSALTTLSEVDSAGNGVAPSTSISAQLVRAPTSKPRLKTSFSLSSVFEREFQRPPTLSHSAEEDCVTLLRIFWRNLNQLHPLLCASCVPLISVTPRQVRRKRVHQDSFPIDRFAGATYNGNSQSSAVPSDVCQ